MGKRNLALLAVFSTAVFYGINYTLVKKVMPNYISPYALVWVRICAATILFWITSFVIKPLEIEKKILLRLLYCLL